MIRLFSLAAVMALLLAGVARAEDASFTLVNRASMTIQQLFVTPAGDANWGQNRLRGSTVAPGGRFVVRRPRDNNCILDIRAVFADGHAEVRRSLNTCNVDAVAVGLPGASDEAALHLINRGALAVTAFYAVPASGGGGWGDNRLAAGPLPPATEKTLRIARTGSSCLFNLRVVFADHTAKERHNADICRMTDLPVP